MRTLLVTIAVGICLQPFQANAADGIWTVDNNFNQSFEITFWSIDKLKRNAFKVTIKAEEENREIRVGKGKYFVEVLAKETDERFGFSGVILNDRVTEMKDIVSRKKKKGRIQYEYMPDDTNESGFERMKESR